MVAATSAVRQERRSRATGTTVQVLDLTHPDSPVEPDEENRWATVCVDHGGFCSHLTLALARSHAAQPDGWCEWCMATISCASCGGQAPWHDEAWVCDDCGDEWYPDENGDPQ